MSLVNAVAPGHRATPTISLLVDDGLALASRPEALEVATGRPPERP